MKINFIFKMKTLTTLFFLLMACTGYAQEQDTLKRVPEPTASELQFIGYSFTRMTATNIAPTNDILQGQIIGRLFGTNSTNTLPQTSVYAEQRFVPLFVYKPSILDGVATFRGLFKIDFTWGDQAYGVGGNRGGSINAGQVNLQTLLANVEVKPKDATWNGVLGLQRLFDNVRDPNTNTVQTAQTSGYKLAYWGTQAVGLNFFWDVTPYSKFRLGFYELWENTIAKDDDVTLFMADYERRINPWLETGLDLWYVHDNGQDGGGISVLGQGLTSALAEYNGAVRLRFPGQTQLYKANIFWAGARFSYNRDFFAGRWWADGFVMSNFGVIDTLGATPNKAADILGAAANLSLAYKYGMTVNDKITLEGIYTTGDKNNASDGKVSSVITGNVYGSPTGIYSSHHSLLLFPDPKVVNRYYSVVQDISNMGYGVTGVFLNFYRDIIPNKLNVKLGGATAFANQIPDSWHNKYMGTEVNMEITYTYKVLFQFGLHAAYLKLGNFYENPNVTNSGQKPKDPFTIFSTVTWYMF